MQRVNSAPSGPGSTIVAPSLRRSAIARSTRSMLSSSAFASSVRFACTRARRRCARRRGAAQLAKLAYGCGGCAADAEHGQLVLRVVAGDRVEHPRRVLHRAAHRPDAHVEPGADHPVAAHQLLRRRQADDAVDGRPASGPRRPSLRRSRTSRGWPPPRWPSPALDIPGSRSVS